MNEINTIKKQMRWRGKDSSISKREITAVILLCVMQQRLPRVRHKPKDLPLPSDKQPGSDPLEIHSGYSVASVSFHHAQWGKADVETDGEGRGWVCVDVCKPNVLAYRHSCDIELGGKCVILFFLALLIGLIELSFNLKKKAPKPTKFWPICINSICMSNIFWLPQLKC